MNYLIQLFNAIHVSPFIIILVFSFFMDYIEKRDKRHESKELKLGRKLSKYLKWLAVFLFCVHQIKILIELFLK